mgnify:CR=1 FL=1
MSRFIYGLSFDYVQQNGHFLVIGREDGLPSEHFSSLSLKMLQSTDVPRLLPLRVEQWNLHNHIYYSLASKRMLSPVLRGIALNRNDFYRLLYNIAAAIDDSKLYMLNEQNYILHEDFLFIGKDVGDVHLVYVPLKQLPLAPPIRLQLKELIERLGEKVDGGSDPDLRRVIAFTEQETFSAAGFAHMLRELLYADGKRARDEWGRREHDAAGHSSGYTAENIPGKAEGHATGNVAGLSSADTTGNTKGNTAGNATGNVARNAAGSVTGGAGGDTGEKAWAADIGIGGSLVREPFVPEPEYESARVEDFPAAHWGKQRDVPDDDPRSNPEPLYRIERHKVQLDSPGDVFRELSLRENLLLALPVATILAIIWSRFAEQPEEASFYINVGITLLVCDAAYVFSKIWRPKLRWKRPRLAAPFVSALGQGIRAGATNASANEIAHGNGESSFAASSAVANVSTVANVSASSAAADRRRSATRNDAVPSADVSTNSYYDSLPNKTTILAPSQRTVLLSPVQGDGAEANPGYALEIRHSGRMERVPLKETSFIIGRGPEGVQYACDDAGVSRVHAEICREGDDFFIRDLGSRNGSFLNGEMIIPYKLYPFREGDVLTVVSAEFTLRPLFRLRG